MVDQTCIADAACQIQALEPVAGAALAINLAYLALDRFRYKNLIQEYASAKLSPDEIHTDTRLHGTTSFKVLCWMAGPRAPRICQTIKLDRRPTGFLASAYHWLFLFWGGLDEYLAVAAALWSYLTVLVGVAYAIGAFKGFVGLWTYIFSAPASLTCLALATLLPVVFVVIGRSCVGWADTQSNEMGEELNGLAEHMKGLVQNIVPPNQ